MRRDVLLADERRPVPGLAQRVDDVAPVVAQLPAAVREPGHAVHVRPLAGQQARPAARAGRRRAERLAEQQALVGQALDVRRRDLVAVGLDVAAGVVRMQVDDVRRRHRVVSFVDRYSEVTVDRRTLQAYLVCATPRSGSTLLCEMLRATGVAGRPLEHFEVLRALRPAAPAARVLRGTWTRRARRAAPAPLEPGAPSGEPPDAWRARIVREGRGENGVWGGKLMWGHVEDLVTRARELAGLAGADLEHGAAGAARRSAARVRHASRQGRPGRLAVAGGPDPELARRRRRKRRRRGVRFAAIDHLVSSSRPTTRHGASGSRTRAGSRSRCPTSDSQPIRGDGRRRCCDALGLPDAGGIRPAAARPARRAVGGLGRALRRERGEAA